MTKICRKLALRSLHTIGGLRCFLLFLLGVDAELGLFRAFGEKSPSTEAWRTLIPFSSDFCYAITDLQDQKESPLHLIEPCR